MNNHNLVIYEFDELYKILVEIKKDINLSFEKANKQKLVDLNSKTNHLVFTKKEIPGLNNQIVFNDFPIPIFKLLEKINIEFISFSVSLSLFSPKDISREFKLKL